MLKVEKMGDDVPEDGMVAECWRRKDDCKDCCLGQMTEFETLIDGGAREDWPIVSGTSARMFGKSGHGDEWTKKQGRRDKSANPRNIYVRA